MSPVVKALPQPRPAVRGASFDEVSLVVPEAGEIVLSMGSGPTDLLRSHGIVPKSGGLVKLSGTLYPAGEGKGHWMVTYDPKMVDVDVQAEVDIGWAVRLAMRWLSTGTLAPTLGLYRYVPDFSAALARIAELHAQTGKLVPLTEDLETLSTDPWDPIAWIISVALSVGEGGGTSDVVTFPSPEMPIAHVVEQLRAIEADPRVTLAGANLKFDNLWKRVKWGLPSPPRFKFDTLLGGGLLNENMRNSLNIQAKLFTPIGGYDDTFNALHDKGRMDLALAGDPAGFLTYAGGDTDACARVRVPVLAELRADPFLHRFYTTILHRAAVAFEAIEARGMEINVAALEAVGVQCTEAAMEARGEMDRLAPAPIRLKHAERFDYTPRVISEIFFGDRGWGLTPKVLTDSAEKARRQAERDRGLRRDALPPTEYLAELPEDERLKSSSTSVDDHLKMFASHPQAGPFVGALKKKNQAEKIQSSYVTGFLKHVRADGRIHPVYGLYNGSLFEWAKKGSDDEAGTNTGRTSAKNPHVQTIPKRGIWAKPLRRCYPAPPGQEVFNVDYDQGELKITACQANEQTMIEAYATGKDLHLRTGTQLAGMEYEEGERLGTFEKDTPEHDRYDEIRYGAKAANFGFVYGQSPPGFVDYAFREWDIIMSLREAEAKHGAFFDLYPGLVTWHDRQIAYARKFRMVRSPLGRVRHLPLIRSRDRRLASKAGRQAINSPVQSTLSDLCLWSIAIAELDLQMGKEGLNIIGMTHDSITGYLPTGRHDLVHRLASVMENLPLGEVFEWQPQLRFTVSAETGPSLGELKKLPRAW